MDYSLDPLLNAIVSIPALDTQGAGADASAAANILEIDWGFVTVPREVSFASDSPPLPSAHSCDQTFGNRTIHYERGKTLGGSSTRNFQIYQRGTVGSYDQWEALGNEGWGWKGLKPYFDKVSTWFRICTIQFAELIRIPSRSTTSRRTTRSVDSRSRRHQTTPSPDARTATRSARSLLSTHPRSSRFPRRP